MDNKGFRDLVHEVSQELTREESQDLAILNCLPDRFHDVRTILVMLQLETRCIISENNPETLAIQLERLRRADLAHRVRKWNSNKKSNKKSDNSRLYSCPVVAVALARMQIANADHQIGLILQHMQYEDSNLVEAKAMCKKINNLLSRFEKKGILPNSVEVSSELMDTDDDISPPSSLTSDSSQINEGIYEPLNYPEIETGNISPKSLSSPSSPKITSSPNSPTGSMNRRPPQPAPKPAKRGNLKKTQQLPTQPIRADQQPKVFNASVLPNHRVAIPLVGLSESSFRIRNEAVSDSGGEEGEEEGTGDSSLYTGSRSDSGFSDAQQFLKTNLKRTLITPKEETVYVDPVTMRPNDRYMSLQRNKTPSAEYAKLQAGTKDDSEYSYTTNYRRDSKDIYSVPQYERQPRR